MTSPTSLSVNTRSPMTSAAPDDVILNAVHEPSANAGFRVTDPALTVRSVRGKLNLMMLPGCIEPLRPSIFSTAIHEESAVIVCAAVGAAARNEARQGMMARWV